MNMGITTTVEALMIFAIGVLHSSGENAIEMTFILNYVYEEKQRFRKAAR